MIGNTGHRTEEFYFRQFAKHISKVKTKEEIDIEEVNKIVKDKARKIPIRKQWYYFEWKYIHRRIEFTIESFRENHIDFYEFEDVLNVIERVTEIKYEDFPIRLRGILAEYRKKVDKD